MITFADLGIPFPLYEAPIETCPDYVGKAYCCLTGGSKEHCFKLHLEAREAGGLRGELDFAAAARPTPFLGVDAFRVGDLDVEGNYEGREGRGGNAELNRGDAANAADG